jgi:hypothetical protein
VNGRVLKVPEQAEKVVVLSTMLNDWRQGEVINRSQLVFRDPRGGDNPDHDAYDRLVAAGAVRPLREGEEGLQSVPVPTAGLSTEAQLKLGQMDAQIDQLTRNLSAMKERLDFHRAQNPAAAPAPEEDPTVAAAIAERQARLDHLTAAFEVMRGQLGEFQGKTSEADQARGQAAHEARGGRQIATGQAPPLDWTREQAAGQAGQGAGGGATGARPAPPPPSPPQDPPPPPRRGRPPRSQEEGGEP